MRRILLFVAAAATAVGLSAGPANAAVHPAAAYPTQLGRIQYDTRGPDLPVSNARLNGEYVTITLHGTASRNLQGWALYDASGHAYTLPSVYLSPGRSLRVHTGPGRNTAADLYAGYRYYIWTNTGDRARLRDSRGHLIDECGWRSAGAGYTTCG